MIIANEQVVSLSYTLKINSFEGELVDQTDPSNPFVFIYGIGSLLPEFEKNILGLKKGDSFSFKLTADEGYGSSDPEYIVPVPKNIFIMDGKINDEILFVGNVVPLQDQEGNPMEGLILEIGEESVTIDFNHPLAGQDLFFQGKIENVRQATSSELDYGHVHGEGGFDH